MSYPLKCCATTIFNTVANVGASFASRYNPNVSLHGGNLFAAITGVTYSIIYIAAHTLVDIRMKNKERFREIDLESKERSNDSEKMRTLILMVVSLATATAFTSLITPKIGSLVGLATSYKTSTAFALFNIPTTLLSAALFAIRDGKGPRHEGGPGKEPEPEVD